MKYILMLAMLAMLAITSLANADATFSPLNPPPTPLVLSTPNIASGSSTNFNYNAYYATSCYVGSSAGTIISGTGTCPVLGISNGSCTGSGPQLKCTGTGTVTSTTNTLSCNYTVGAVCSPGNVTSTTILTVTAGAVPPPSTDCSSLTPIVSSTGRVWTRVGTTSVTYGDNTTKTNVDATSYTAIWNYPGFNAEWPGNFGLTTRPKAGLYQYFSEKFTVPANKPIGLRVTWPTSGSGINSNGSATVSTCPGDFGQTGTQVPQYCRMEYQNSLSGLRTMVATTQQGTYCTLKPGNTYYLNILPMGSLPAAGTNNPVDSMCTASPCNPWFGVFNG